MDQQIKINEQTWWWMASLNRSTTTFSFDRFSRRYLFLCSLRLEALTTCCWRRAWWFWWAWWSGSTGWRTIAGIAAVASFPASASFTSGTSTTRFSRPRVAPFVRLFDDNFPCRSNHSSLAQVVIFIVWHSMCRKFAITRHATVRILLEMTGTRSSTWILGWWAVVEARTHSWGNFHRGSLEENKC